MSFERVQVACARRVVSRLPAESKTLPEVLRVQVVSGSAVQRRLYLEPAPQCSVVDYEHSEIYHGERFDESDASHIDDRAYWSALIGSRIAQDYAAAEFVDVRKGQIHAGLNPIFGCGDFSRTSAAGSPEFLYGQIMSENDWPCQHADYARWENGGQPQHTPLSGSSHSRSPVSRNHRKPLFKSIPTA